MKRFMIIISLLILLIALFLIFVVVINRLVIFGAGEIIDGNEEYEINKKYDAIVVLGASVLSDGSPSNMLEDRLRGAVELYKKGIAPKIIVSGDCSIENDYDETASMKSYCIINGVPEADIVIDGKGYSTYESMYNVVEKMGYKSFIVVTQRYHTYRAVYTARQLGADADGFANNYRDYMFFPQLQRDFREIAARIKDFFKVKFAN